MNKLERILFAISIAIYILFFLYSFTQVDLNLTLFQFQPLNQLIKSAQGIGYFNREVSTIIYITLITIVFIFFAINLLLFYKEKISKKYLFISTITSVIILIFSYPFLSYDIFNYIFDAKIIAHYGANPYSHKPLDFPGDPYLRFMRWTHRYSPYGPLWLIYSLVPFYLGMGKFLLTLIFFKVFIGSFHILNTFLIGKILAELKSPKQNFYTAIYALNPALILEGVSNAHNDIVLAFFILGTVYFYLKRKNKIWSALLIIGSLIKYLTIFLIPAIVIMQLKKSDTKTFILLNLICLALFTFIYSTFSPKLPFIPSASIQNQFQPWYLFWTIPLIPLLKSRFLTLTAVTISFFTMFRYVPYLYFGVWSEPGSTQFMQVVLILPVLFLVTFYFIWTNFKKI